MAKALSRNIASSFSTLLVFLSFKMFQFRSLGFPPKQWQDLNGLNVGGFWREDDIES